MPVSANHEQSKSKEFGGKGDLTTRIPDAGSRPEILGLYPNYAIILELFIPRRRYALYLVDRLAV